MKAKQLRSFAAAVAMVGSFVGAAAAEERETVPDKVRTALFWLDAADESTMTKDACGNLAAWRSKAGDRRVAKAVRSSLKPVYQPTAWGRPTVDFGSVGNGRDMVYPRFTDIRTVFEVVKIDPSGAAFLLGDIGGGTSPVFFHRSGAAYFLGNKAYAPIDKVWNGLRQVENYTTEAVPSDGFQVICFTTTKNCCSDSVSRDRDRGIAGGDRVSGRQLSELILFNEVVSDADRKEITNYLIRKWRRLAEGVASTVFAAPGMTCLKRPMKLTAADSGKRFVGAPDGSTVLSGGERITGWTARADGTWAAKAPFFFETLFVNGRRAVRAREPNTGFFHVRSAVRGGGDGKANAVGLQSGEAALLARVPAADLPYVHLVIHTKWDLFRRPLSAFDASSGRASFSEPVPFGRLDPQEQYYFENLRSAFDAPGEWFYDAAAGEVLYRPLPGERIDWFEAIAPRPGLTTLVEIDGAEDVTFENVTFAYTSPAEGTGPSTYNAFQAAIETPAAVRANRARRIVFRNCAFRHTGAYGLNLEAACASNRVESCRFEDLGSGGMKIGQFDRRTLKGSGDCRSPAAKKGAVVRPPSDTAFNVVTNCVFRQGGRFIESGIGVIIGHASDNVVVKNTIEDFYYTGISVGWIWGYSGSVAQRNQIGYNRIRRIGQKVLSDMGGIYTLGTSFGTRLYNNVISDVDSYSYGGWGLYPDEGSEGIVLENNLVYDTMDASFHQHYGRGNVLRNNILAFSEQCQVAVTRAEPHRSMTVENNILLWRSGDAFGTRYGGIRNGAQVTWRGNLWWCAGGEPRYNGATYAQWAAGGRDAGGAVADPLFVDAAKRDFRLKPDSPALKLGFVPFDPDAAGSDLRDERRAK